MDSPAHIAAVGQAVRESRHDLGAEVTKYRCGFGSTKGLIIFAVSMIAFPLLMAIPGAFDRHHGLSFVLGFTAFLEAFFLPLGLLALWGGIRQRRVSLTFFEHGFEYVTPAGRPMSARYTDIQSLALQRVNAVLRLVAPAMAQSVAHEPNSLAVKLKGGWSLDIKCLGTRDLKEAHGELERRMFQKGIGS